MKREDIASLLGDPRPEIRNLGAHLAAEHLVEGSEDLLAIAILDPVEAVGAGAAQALIRLQPWLAMRPHPRRPLPRAHERDVYASAIGRAWRLVRRGIRTSLGGGRGPAPADALRRWLLVPGAVPEIQRVLGLAGGPDAPFARTGTADGDEPVLNQVLLAPSYRCNIDCAYCYVKGWRQHYGWGEMQRETVDRLLDWCVGAGANYLILGGGEPTLYRHFGYLLREAAQRGIRVRVTSNTLYPTAVREHLSSALVHEFVSHFEQDLLKPGNTRERRYRENLAAVRDSGVPLVLRVTLTDHDDPESIDRIIALAAEFGIGIVNFGFAFRGWLGDNRHVRFAADGGDGLFEATLSRLVCGCRAAGIRPLPAKPFPLCAVSPPTLRLLADAGVLLQSCTAPWRGYSMNVTVNPDLSTLPCNAIGRPGPAITSFPSLEAAGRHHRALLLQAGALPHRPQCLKCLLHYHGQCPGVCLAEKLGSAAHP